MLALLSAALGSTLLFLVLLAWLLDNMGACFGSQKKPAGIAIVANPSATSGNNDGPRYDASGQRVFGQDYEVARAQAKAHAAKMKAHFDAAHSLFASNKKADAKSESDAGKREQSLMEQANARAVRAVIDPQRLEKSDTDTIDLHGLFVKEAVAETTAFVQRAMQLRVLQTVHIITGQGHHSVVKEHSAVREAILQLAQTNRWQMQADARNAGKFSVHCSA